MLLNIITDLIDIKQEGSYWDFKRVWYTQENKADLLHDIICMANNIENRDAYIIIGVDEENDYEIINIKDDINRKNTQKIVDFLKDKKFVGGIRPTVYVKSFLIDFKCIDVIVIKNSYNTPFYLTDKYHSIKSNNIYTRMMDTNTPKDRSADIHIIEYLWKKRFRLISTPLERVKYYLERPDEWSNSPVGFESDKKYHNIFPEFSIEYTLNDDGNAYEYYLFNQDDITPHWRKVRIFYHQTLLTELEGVSLDGARYFTPTPETDGISLAEIHNWDIVFKYFVKDSLRYIIHQFYYEADGDDETIAHDRFEECILFFDSEDEKESFKKYVLQKWDNKEQYTKTIILPYFQKIKGYKMEVLEEQYQNVQILREMLIEYRNIKIKL
ncbi:MAG: ATP-binding protein [Firmicutes bacterium]|nr:ATP-binding protein [Bacillota bacterium]